MEKNDHNRTVMNKINGRKVSIVFLTTGVFLLSLTLLFLLLPAKPASAQCKNLSSCNNCHEVQGQLVVSKNGAWHIDHAAYDLCAVCHGGDAEAQDAATAHKNMVTRLSDMPGSCTSCHSADLEQRFNKYASQLNVTDTSALSAAQKASNPLQGAEQFFGQQPAVVSGVSETAAAGPAAAGPEAAAPAAKPTNKTGNLILGGLLVAILASGGGYITWNERRLAKIRGPRERSWLIEMVSKEHWSPYAAGILLGITYILSVLLAGRTLGASSAISGISSTLVNQVAPNAASKNMYFKFLMPPGFNWEIAVLIGIFFGGMLGALSSRTFRLRWNGDPTWNKVFGQQRWKRFVAGFLGAIILQYGAGIAGGCTSGLAIAGGMLLAPSAFLFMAGMFATGIVVALLVYRRKY
jgi:uncharacterized protein